MDAFTLAFSYGIKKVDNKSLVITSIVTGIFHFIMPLMGNIIGIPLFEYTLIKPRYILFFVFLIISIDMFINFFNENPKLRNLNIAGIILFAFSVSFDSFSVGLGINYICSNVVLSVSIFCFVSMLFTFLGFMLGKVLSQKIGKYAFLFGSLVLFIYSLVLLT